jgi:ssDNA-binding Zn-finger/Zn-ribbon topoisomerase 1
LNIRAHFNLKVKGVKYNSDEVGFPEIDKYCCQYCFSTFRTLLNRKGHLRGCNHPDNSYRIDYNEKRKQQRNLKVECDNCGKQLNQSSLSRHKKSCKAITVKFSIE